MRYPAARLFACAALLAASGVQAQSDSMPPGMWEIRSKMEMPGMPAGMGEQTQKVCIKPGEKHPYHQADKGAGGKPECTQGPMRTEGGRMAFEVTCKDGTRVKATVVSSKDAFTTTAEITSSRGGQAMTMKQVSSGKRIGDCK